MDFDRHLHKRIHLTARLNRNAAKHIFAEEGKDLIPYEGQDVDPEILPKGYVPQDQVPRQEKIQLGNGYFLSVIPFEHPHGPNFDPATMREIALLHRDKGFVFSWGRELEPHEKDMPEEIKDLFMHDQVANIELKDLPHIIEVLKGWASTKEKPKSATDYVKENKGFPFIDNFHGSSFKQLVDYSINYLKDASFDLIQGTALPAKRYEEIEEFANEQIADLYDNLDKLHTKQYARGKDILQEPITNKMIEQFEEMVEGILDNIGTMIQRSQKPDQEESEDKPQKKAYGYRKLDENTKDGINIHLNRYYIFDNGYIVHLQRLLDSNGANEDLTINDFDELMVSLTYGEDKSNVVDPKTIPGLEQFNEGLYHADHAFWEDMPVETILKLLSFVKRLPPNETP